jgi:hypothetical protein
VAVFELRSDESASVEQTSTLPSHKFAPETATAQDTFQLERIQFWLFSNESVSGADNAFRLVTRDGNSPDIGWRGEPIQTVGHSYLDPGDSISWLVEDQLKSVCINDFELQLGGPKAENVTVSVVESWFDGALLWQHELLQETFQAIGERHVVKPTAVLSRTRARSWRVTFTNNDPDAQRFVWWALLGWATFVTKNPTTTERSCSYVSRR